MITLAIDKNSPFLGEECPFCEHPFAPGDEVIICPECAARHHIHCWETNNGRCAVEGCTGANIPDEPDEEELTETVEEEDTAVPPPSTPQHSSSPQRVPSHYSCAQSCLVMAIAMAILVFAFACFGIWAIADYLMLEVWGWQYRDPFSEASLFPQIITAVSVQML